MNILFLSISHLPSLEGHSISIDLIHELVRRGHKVYAVCAQRREGGLGTELSEECGATVLRVRIGKNKKANPIVKGITTLRAPSLYIGAVKKYLPGVRFDLVMYPTPPVTQYKTVRYIKRRDGARSYLLLKDIFPQNAVDIGMMKKGGLKGILYKHFRKTERRLYAISDKIGCMSQANCDYLLKHNPEIAPEKVEVCPNSVEFVDMRIDDCRRREMREKYSLPADKRIFVYGGNLGRPQGIPHLMRCLDAASGVEGAHFLIVGDGTEYKKLREFVDSRPDAPITLLSKLPKAEYDALCSACDVGLIFLDHRFTIPNFPSRLLAYMQSGLPVISVTDPNTDVGKVITEAGFGWSSTSGEAEEFAALVREAMTAELDSMGERAVQYLKENYTVRTAYEIIEKSVM